jgi:hypothetical protein
MASTNPRYAIRNELTERSPKQSETSFVKDEKGAIRPNIAEAFSHKLWKINVFSDHEMKKRVPKPVMENLKAAIRDGTVVDRATADVVAQAMKEWYTGSTFIFFSSIIFQGFNKRVHPLYPLVSTHPKWNCRKARFIYRFLWSG